MALTIGALGAALSPRPTMATTLLVAVTAALLGRHYLLSRSVQLLVLVSIVMLIPMHFYAPAGVGSAAVDPYRLIVLLMVATAFLRGSADRRDPTQQTRRRPQGALAAYESPASRWQPMGHGRFVALLFVAAIVSDAVSMEVIAAGDLQGNVLSGYLKLGTYLLVLVLARQQLKNGRDVERLLTVLVTAATITALGAVFERLTSVNVFHHLDAVLPLHRVTDGPSGELMREGGIRAAGSAEHPIALAALLVMVLPIAIYLTARAPSGLRRYLLAAAGVFLLAGAAATTSRTAIVMLLAMAATAAIVRRRALRRLAPSILIAAVVVNVVIVPGAFDSVIAAFEPSGGFVAEQTGASGTTGGGRLGDLPAVSALVVDHPLFGVGFGTRIFSGPHANALILDNEYLGRLVESGLIGLVAVAIVIGAPLWAMARLARRHDGPMGDLAGALATSFAGYGISMATYDAMAFTQVTVVYFLLVAVSVVVVESSRGWPTDGATRW